MIAKALRRRGSSITWGRPVLVFEFSPSLLPRAFDSQRPSRPSDCTGAGVSRVFITNQRPSIYVQATRECSQRAGGCSQRTRRSIARLVLVTAPAPSRSLRTGGGASPSPCSHCSTCDASVHMAGCSDDTGALRGPGPIASPITGSPGQGDAHPLPTAPHPPKSHHPMPNSGRPAKITASRTCSGKGRRGGAHGIGHSC